MPFVLRVSSTPSLNRLLELSQVVIVDQTGPAIPLGVSPGATCLVGEFLKGPFVPTEVTSSGELISLFGGVSDRISQSISGATLVQDGGGQRYEGNGALALVGKQFRRLVIQRVDTDATTTDAGTTKAVIKFTVKVDPADRDASFVTNKDILIPAGQRFGDDATGTTGIVALSQDVLIPNGTQTTLSGADRVVVVTFDTLTQDNTGRYTYAPTSTSPRFGATGFFVKNSTLAISALDTAIDTSLPNVASVLRNTAGDVDALTPAGAATAIFAPGTAAATLLKKIDSVYAAAIDKTRPSGAPQEDITVIWSARRGFDTTSIRTPIVNNAIDSSSEGRGRIAVVSGPRVGAATDGTNGYGDAATVSAAKTEVQNTTTAESPGRTDRKIVAFPYVQIFSADLNKLVVVAPDGFMCSTLANFPEEKNPGARNDFIQSILNFQDEFLSSPMSKQDYINFKAKGVAALRRDRAIGWLFQEGITSVDPLIEQTRAPIKRRRMADFIQDTLASIAANYNKEPATQDRIDQFTAEIEAFLISLKSPPNPAQQRIENFDVDAVSGNTPQLVALGIFAIIVKVRLLASLDVIVYQTQIGETVEIEETA